MAEQEYPSLGEQGKNLAKFTFEVIKEAFANGHSLQISKR